MTRVSTRVLRIGGIALVAIGALAWLGSGRALDGSAVGYGFGSLDVGEPVYVSVALAEADATVRWADIEAVGPVEARLVLCPDADQADSRECAGGPVDALGSELAQHQEGDDPIGPSALFLEVRRLEPAAAAVCTTRVLHTTGLRLGLQQLPSRVGLPALDDEVDESGWENPADTLCR